MRDWAKSLAVHQPGILSIAAHPVLLKYLQSVLGNDIMLWGSSFVRSSPGHIHPWHNDIESSVVRGSTFSVWIGLENVTQQSSLQMISRSHLFRESVQEARIKRHVRRGEASAEMVLGWAQEKDPQCDYITPAMSNGQAILFDGWLWHASWNTGKTTRTALLLQYATPDAVIRIPVQSDYEWPFRTLAHPKPPCIMISGSDRYGVNKIVPPPVTDDGQQKHIITTFTHRLDIPLTIDKSTPWRPYPLFHGATPNLQSLTCHASALQPGETPHPPHHHREDEILILLDGEAEVTLPDLVSEGQNPVVPMRPGDFVFYPAWFYHTITARGDRPANYLMLKWYHAERKDAEIPDRKLGYIKCSFSDLIPAFFEDRLFKTQLAYQGKTDCLARLQCHISVLRPGGGYPAHVDAHDVAIVVMNGEVESLGVRSGPHSVLFFASGEPHDMYNPGESVAEYLVFEFHGTHAPAEHRKKRTLWQKIRNRRSWKAKFRELREKLG